jgi:hypothetical protein
LYVYTNKDLGVTSSGHSYTISICFLPSQDEVHIAWALDKFKKYGINPRLVVTDADDATQNAVKQVFSGVPTLLCLWHINECVKRHYKDIVGYDKDGWAAFDIR